MIAILEKTWLRTDESFLTGISHDSLEKSSWHYHNHYEISFITEGVGKRIVADSIEDFQPGDLVFIGKNLPHVWIADKEQPAPVRALESVFLQFTSDILWPQLIALPEFRNVARALSLSERGLQIYGETLNEISKWMLLMPCLEGFERIIHLYMILNTVGKSAQWKPLASREYMKARFMPGNRRIARIHEFLMNNYKDEIDLKQLAELINMTESALCRFFKQNTGMTLFEYLNRIKTDFACKLLMNNDLSVLEICLDSGYNNLSHFNKQFRKNTGLSPSEYRRKFTGLLQD
ncbi:MAG: AraC family transcriptional regulator [Tannerella sp.]|jgi:AraC-like DNA-binding protein|nr:AraC family transcriptional regulator [Tannerella sp.]